MEKTLKSGAILDVQLASFDVSCELLEAVTAEAEKVRIDIGTAMSDLKDIKDVMKIDMNNETLNTLKNAVTRLISSQSIKEAVWKCAAWSTYNKIKIVKSNNVFEKEESRGDYLIVMKEILMANISPFFNGLESLLSEIPKKST